MNFEMILVPKYSCLSSFRKKGPESSSLQTSAKNQEKSKYQITTSNDPHLEGVYLGGIRGTLRAQLAGMDILNFCSKIWILARTFVNVGQKYIIFAKAFSTFAQKYGF